MKTVDTVALIITQDDKVLVEKRSIDKATDPGLVAIPGGHVEDGETHLQACRRELKEELNLECPLFIFITKKLWKTPIENQLIHYYLCEGWYGELESYEASEVFYIDMDDLVQLDVEIDREAVREMLASRR